MLDITKDIQSLTNFRRKSGEFLKQLKKSKRPIVLTVNGRAEAVVQDNGLEKATYTLERSPHRCPIAPEGKGAKRPLRHLLCGSKPDVYRVIFEIDERRKRVRVLTVIHGAMKRFSKA